MSNTVLTLPYAVAVDTFKRLAHTIPRRAVLPVLTSARLDGTTIASTDLEHSTVITLDAAAVDGPPALLPVAAINTGLRGIRGTVTSKRAADQPVHIVSTHDGRVTISAFDRTLHVADDAPVEVVDYLKLPEVPGKVVARIGADALASALTFANSARGSDDTLPMLTGIRIEGADGLVSFAATDRYRLAVTDTPARLVEDFEMLLPGGALKAVTALAGEVAVHVEGYMAAFVADNGTVIARLLEATFPAFRSLIPAQGGASWLLDRDRLLADVQAAASVAGKHDPVKITFDAERVAVNGCGNIAPASVIGADRAWLTGFNPAYLVQGLKAFIGQRVDIRATAPVKPYVFSGQRPGGVGIYLLMPTRLPEEQAA